VLSHRVTTETAEGRPAGASAPARPEVQTAGRLRVSSQRALVVGPPLEGTGWVALNSCCAGGHRQSGFPVNGQYFVAQRFAIDWMKLDENRHMYKGSETVNRDYPTYGQNAIAVADGKVASVLDGLPERVSGALPGDTTLQNASGNHVILDLGGGRFAFYAHLQPGSIQVRKGDHVKRGQVLMRIDPADLNLAVHAQQEAVAAARARAQQTAEDEARYRDLRGTGAISRFANFTVRETPPVPWERRPPPMPAGTLTRWRLSPSFDALTRDLERPLPASEATAMRWQEVEAEPPGFVVINRYRDSPHPRVSFANDFSKRLEPQPGTAVVYATTTIEAERDQVKKLLLGYSDEVTVFLNGRILYRGRSAQNFRDPGFLGIVNPENDALYLPLRKGRNELVLAVSELGGGWGFICRVE